MVCQNTFWFKHGKILVVSVYAVLFVLISLFVFYLDDESRPIAEFLNGDEMYISLNDKVMPFFEEQEIPLLRILTDPGTEYCGKAEYHE